MLTISGSPPGWRRWNLGPSSRILRSWYWVSSISLDTSITAVHSSASKKSIRRFVITEKAPTGAFSWLKAATTAFTFKTLC